MCGLFGGVSSLLTKEEVGFVFNLGFLSRFRGGHATGVGIVANNDKKFQIGLRKQAIPAGVFFEMKETEEFVGKYTKPVMVLGHTRHATGGAMTELNAHPFLHKHIMGAHNGVMDSFKDKTSDDRLERSDSNLFFEMLAEEGLKEALTKAHKSHQAAYALTWYDRKTHSLNMIRNDKRPLFLMIDGPGTSTYWASEVDFLRFMDSRTMGTTFKTPFSVVENTLYKFPIGGNTFSSEKIDIPKVYPVTSFTRTSTWEEEENWANYYNHPPRPGHNLAPWEDDPNHPSNNREQERFRRLKDKKEERKVITLPVVSLGPVGKRNHHSYPELKDHEMVYIGYKGDMTPVAEMKDQLRKGIGPCFCCDYRAMPNDKVFWRSKTEYVCAECYVGETMKMMEGAESLKKDYTESIIVKCANAEVFIKGMSKADKKHKMSPADIKKSFEGRLG